MMQDSTENRWRIGSAESQLWAWLAVGVVTTLASFALPGTRVVSVRLLEHAYDLGQHLGLGVISCVVVLLWSRFVARPRVVPWLLGAAAFAVSWPLLSEDLAILSGKIAVVGPARLYKGLLVAGAAATLSGTFWLARRARATWARALGAALGLLAAATNSFVLRHDYPGVHFVIAWAAALLLAGSLGARRSPSNRRALVLVAPAALVAIGALLVPPPNAVALELSRSSGSVVAPFLARVRSSVAVARWVDSSDPWFASRAAAPPAPPSEPALLPPNAVVVLLSVDCLRADVIENPEHAAKLPALARLRDESSVFTHARTTAPATTQAITTITTSTLYSQLYWTPLDERFPEYVYPHKDPAPRFTEALTGGGVHTASIQGLPGISQKYGLVRGVSEEVILRGGRAGFAGVSEQLPVVLDVLKKHAAGPLFIYAHFGDPHAPYDRGGSGTPFQRYLGEIRLVDDGIGKIVAAVDELGLRQRAAIIVSADHGEAFGEHGMTAHATALYDELLRVPLLVRVPGARAGRIEEPVSLLDLAPTILDLFGRPAPGSFMGQSLVPLLAGKQRQLERPIAFESGRAQRGMLFPDGLKIIQQQRGGILEIYDVRSDPGERKNLFAGSEHHVRRVALMERFFAAHRVQRPGYELPFAR